MPGTSRSGRTPKPLALHALHGTIRHDRHGASDMAPIEGPVTMPTLAGDALKFWQAIVAPLENMGVVTPGDVPAATALCETWSLYRAAIAVAISNPCDKEARCAVTAYLSAFERLAARFGLTPSDRARLKLPEREPEESDFTKFLNRRSHGIPKRDREFQNDISNEE